MATLIDAAQPTTRMSTRMYLAWTSALYELPQTGCLHTPQGQQSLSSLGRIPKRIWIAWIDPRIEDHEPDHPFVKYGIGRLRTQNRGWELTIADDAAINAELRKHLKSRAFDLGFDCGSIWEVCWAKNRKQN